MDSVGRDGLGRFEEGPRLPVEPQQIGADQNDRRRKCQPPSCLTGCVEG
jgi:hypothetical protein